jgi:hypothetical protein
MFASGETAWSGIGGTVAVSSTPKSCEDGHHFVVAESGYFKLKKPPETTGLGTPAHDQSKTYYLLYCQKCGATKEVMHE